MKNYRVGTLAGIPILVNPSWFLLAGLVTYLLAFQIYPSSDALQNRGNATYIGMALVSLLLFVGSILLHELAHALVARGYRLPVRNITLFIFGGVAQITREARRPLAELLMAAAGPLTSLVLGVACALLWWALGANDSRPVDHILLWVAVTNGALGIFNLIPAFPMDGGRIFRSLIWMIGHDYNRATVVAAWTGRGFGWTVIALGLLTTAGVEVYVAEGTYGGVWLIFIGFFLENAARQSLQQNRMVRALNSYNAEALMIADPPVVDASIALSSLARGVLEINPRVCYFVEDSGRLAGIISAYQIREVPEALWDTTTAGQAMVPTSRLTAIAPDRSVSEALIEMESGDLTHLPVVREGRVIGVLGRDRIVGALRKEGLLPAHG